MKLGYLFQGFRLSGSLRTKLWVREVPMTALLYTVSGVLLRSAHHWRWSPLVPVISWRVQSCNTADTEWWLMYWGTLQSGDMEMEQKEREVRNEEHITSQMITTRKKWHNIILLHLYLVGYTCQPIKIKDFWRFCWVRYISYKIVSLRFPQLQRWCLVPATAPVSCLARCPRQRLRAHLLDQLLFVFQSSEK